MKIKHKIRIGLGLIFSVVILFGGLSIYFISQLSSSAKVVLKNNYETLSFAKEMRTVLDDNNLPLSDVAKSAFNRQLIKQEHNITEIGENAATAALRKSFNILLSPASNLAEQQRAEHDTRVYLRKIEELNMQAIVRKTDTAEASVNTASIILGIIGCLTFLSLFSFSVNVSRFIADPLIKVAEALEEVAEKNYDYRLNFNKSDEFGDVAIAFNDMVKHVEDQEHKNMAEVFTEKHRVEAIIEHIHDAVIVLNEKQEIAFINTAAQNLLNMHEHKLAGKPASQFTVTNSLFKSILDDQGGLNTFKIEQEGKESIFQLESQEIFIPNIADLRNDELHIARVPAGKIYVLRNLTEYHEI